MKSKILKIAAASLLVTVSVVTAAGCSFKVDMPDNLKQILCEHEWKEGDVLRSATCEREGEVELVCKLCGATDVDEIDKLDHIAETVPGKAATCTSDGYTDGERCIVGGEWITAPKTLKATGHVDEDTNGTCDTCKGSMFESATFETVAKGNVLNGWYRIGVAALRYNEAGNPANKAMGTLVVGTEKLVASSNTVTLTGSKTGYNIDNIANFFEHIMNDNIVKSDSALEDGWYVYGIGQTYDLCLRGPSADEYTFIYFPETVEVSYRTGSADDTETQQKTVDVSGFTFDSCTFSFEKVVF